MNTDLTCIGTVTMRCILLFCLLTSVRARAQGDRVVGGSDVPEGQFPWMVEMLFEDDQHLCGATLVHPQWVLTAGHCALVADGVNMRLIANSINNTTAPPGPNAEELDVDTILYHPDYDGLNGPDLALIKLVVPASTQPITLLDPGWMVQSQNGDSALALGWGTADTVTLEFSAVLQAADVALVEFADCEPLYEGSTSDLFTLNGTSGLWCAAGFTGDAIAGSGNGDSGGPLLVRHEGTLVQLGVVYGGEGQYATAAFPGVYTSVPYNWNWIHDAINGTVLITEAPSAEEVMFSQGPDGLRISLPIHLRGALTADCYASDGRLVATQQGTIGLIRIPWPEGHGMLVVRVRDDGGRVLAVRRFVR